MACREVLEREVGHQIGPTVGIRRRAIEETNSWQSLSQRLASEQGLDWSDDLHQRSDGCAENLCRLHWLYWKLGAIYTLLVGHMSGRRAQGRLV
jgi:hypothetical protein